MSEFCKSQYFSLNLNYLQCSGFSSFADLVVNCSENILGHSKETYEHIELAPAKRILLTEEFDIENLIVQVYGKSFKSLEKVFAINFFNLGGFELERKKFRRHKLRVHECSFSFDESKFDLSRDNKLLNVENCDENLFF